MKFRTLLFIFCCHAYCTFAQQTDTAALAEIRHFQEELNQKYRNPEKSPLPAEALPSFKEHQFFPVNTGLRLKAKLVRTPKAKPFKMTTTKGVLKDYVQFGELHFKIAGKPYMLPVYQSLDLRKKEEYKDFLFLPFTDLTNGSETYGGGRYIDLRIPAGKEVVVDFNQAYNPYCAYSTRYSCPIPPKENHLDIRIEAGVKAPEENH